MNIGRLHIRFYWIGAIGDRALPGRLSEAEVAGAIAVPDGNLQLRAMRQMLDDYIEASDRNSAADIGNGTTIAWNAGGAEKLKQFREWFDLERAIARTGALRDPVKFKRMIVASARDAAGRRPEDEYDDPDH